MSSKFVKNAREMDFSSSIGNTEYAEKAQKGRKAIVKAQEEMEDTLPAAQSKVPEATRKAVEMSHIEAAAGQVTEDTAEKAAPAADTTAAAEVPVTVEVESAVQNRAQEGPKAVAAKTETSVQTEAQTDTNRATEVVQVRDAFRLPAAAHGEKKTERITFLMTPTDLKNFKAEAESLNVKPNQLIHLICMQRYGTE
ncbi:MAG: hypothetical protein IJT34_00270 [Butyrivibrio sp.]|nr:hypothetical protein [Butyrivibrio sp.]